MAMLNNQMVYIYNVWAGWGYQAVKLRYQQSSPTNIVFFQQPKQQGLKQQQSETQGFGETVVISK